ncbi:rolling circle replication-associated protein [Rhodobacter capsulatus]|uniref:rolling circle replication-associated protein n=2 Tax=Rhodobacter capsulatus TaxID=1061 RepID=UPI0003D35A35|nr:hypothetical protein [Rhodobacter capsulatus]ETD01850.1 hypothetical protein U714_10480 [Rhodobacter capsulatus DE442]ETD76908.1 hypothetical protein U717_10635 [Rhodobacter capsulatus R121]ETE53744.1 hypothetical protein U715_10635 [Rhodobacter capsulatus Y262]
MMEKAVSPFTLIVTLTYSDETQEGRDGARMFAYADVSAFIKRLNSAIRDRCKRHKKPYPGGVRFLAAGEQGDRRGRCHWHLALFSSVDITLYGDFLGYPRQQVGPRRKVRLTDRCDLISEVSDGPNARRLNWSLWPLGFAVLQEADEGGMSYVLSYCLKDQFTHEKSKDTFRETKAENFATGLFRMSKRPAIGERWLDAKAERLAARGAVLPSLALQVPEASGYYVPSGTFREKILWHLHAVNQHVRNLTGRDAPQWSALLSSLGNDADDDTLPPDLEILLDVEKIEVPLETVLAQKAAERSRAVAANEVRGRCGGPFPCDACLHGYSKAKLDRLGLFRVDIEDEIEIARYYVKATGERSTKWPDGWKPRLHPDCEARYTQKAADVFPRSAPRFGS